MAAILDLKITQYSNRANHHKMSVKIYYKDDQFVRCEIKSAREKLREMGINTIDQLLDADIDKLTSDLSFVDLDVKSLYKYRSKGFINSYQYCPVKI